MRAPLLAALLAIMSIVLLLSCGEDACKPCGPCQDKDFEVKIVTGVNEPVAGAWIEGGSSWDYFRVKTDSAGIAVVPGSALERHAEISKDNYYPEFITYLESVGYLIEPTPATLEMVGSVSGRAIRFDDDLLITLEYDGRYHTYSYDEDSVTQLVEASLDAASILDVKLVADTLWLSTDDRGVYAYSLDDPLSPALLFHLDKEGYLEALAVRGNVLAVARRSSDSVSVFELGPAWEANLVSAIATDNVRQMAFKSHYLIILSYTYSSVPGAALTVVDLTDPGSPETVYSLTEQGGRSGLILQDYVLLGPNASETTDFMAYTTIDITDPASPVYIGRTMSDAWLVSVCNMSYAVGEYCSGHIGCSAYTTHHAVVRGAPGGRFEIQGILSECPATAWPSVHRPPFFVIGNALWRLDGPYTPSAN